MHDGALLAKSGMDNSTKDLDCQRAETSPFFVQASIQWKAMETTLALFALTAFQEICKEILLSSEDRQSMHKDWELISNSLMQRMKGWNDLFKDAFNGLSLTGSVLDDLKIDFPDEFDMHIKLKMPFPITPYRDEQRPGFVRLQVPEGTRHPIVDKKLLSRYHLQHWIRNVFEKAVGSGFVVDAGVRSYLISYPTYGRGRGVAHTIIAKQIKGGSREISFDFVPAFEFVAKECPLKPKIDVGNEHWFAIPFGKKLRNDWNHSNMNAFMVCAPHWERIALHNKQNLKNSLRLMKALRNVNKMGRISSYMLKSIYLGQLELLPDNFWENPIGLILIKMLEELQNALKEDCLPFYLHSEFNHFDLVPEEDIVLYQRILNDILRKLHYFQNQSKVNYADVARLFLRK